MSNNLLILGILIVVGLIIVVLVRMRAEKGSNSNPDADLQDDPTGQINEDDFKTLQDVFFEKIDQNSSPQFAFKMRYHCFAYISDLLELEQIPHNISYNVIKDRFRDVDKVRSYAIVEVLAEDYAQTIQIINTFIAENEFNIAAADFNFVLEP